LEGGPPSFPQGSSCPVVLRNTSHPMTAFAYGTLTPYGGPFQAPSASRHRPVCRPGRVRQRVLQPLPSIGLPSTQLARFGLSPVRSPLLGASRLISLPRGTEMFQFPRFPHLAYEFSQTLPPMTAAGFSHSGIPGSACWTARRGFSQSSHALHRLRAPRHPP
jgi:hypothetical protein